MSVVVRLVVEWALSLVFWVVVGAVWMAVEPRSLVFAYMIDTKKGHLKPAKANNLASAGLIP
jgi:hypothetical protein